MTKDILIGIDAGTSMIKSVAFDLQGRQIESASIPNEYTVLPDGTASQPLEQTWIACAKTLQDLADKIADLDKRTCGVAVTGQGDGTWLVGKNDTPVGDGWLWLDSRAAPSVHGLRSRPEDRKRFEITGTGLNACQQGVQLAYMQTELPELLRGAESAMHCKDWLYLNMTGERATDPSEACFTFGNFRTRDYDDDVIEILGLKNCRHLLPPIVDGSNTTHPLSEAASRQTGLLAGTPVSLGFVDVVCTVMGAGVYTRGVSAGCSIVGTTGVHMRTANKAQANLNPESTGYVMVLPVPDLIGQLQSNMASTLNIDWMLDLAADLTADLIADGDLVPTKSELIGHVDRWIASGKPGAMLYHPYISEAGERGPFVNPAARAGFVGLNTSHRFPDMLRAVVEGLGHAARDCYSAMGEFPAEVRVTGGAAKSKALRGIFSAAIDTPVRYSSRDEAGATGAAMMSAVALGVFASMDDCIDAWVTPTIGELEQPDPKLADTYRKLFDQYLATRQVLEPVWNGMSGLQETSS